MSDVTVEALPPVGMITLRGDLDTLGAAVADVTGCDRPDQRLRTEAGDHGCLWMSPDELLVTCGYDAAPEIAARLTDALGDAFATVAVVSDARAVFAMTGQGAEAVLARLMPVDFDRMAPTEVRRTRMAQIPAALWREGECWRVVCFRSVAGYAEGLLRNAVPIGA
ncbi:sarcosine oxidase subunit gamma [uncultured Jannaschia sp.]|uniref:sarcosine oxidase subunit gamma n=1 Tax=uncultured Jannaschia sp. TaxID=293347 RepID=UPI0026341608|nr:sarcosine oxidase subunit gamma [uncultured Jannaschia sp.]